MTKTKQVLDEEIEKLCPDITGKPGLDVDPMLIPILTNVFKSTYRDAIIKIVTAALEESCSNHDKMSNTRSINEECGINEDILQSLTEDEKGKGKHQPITLTHDNLNMQDEINKAFL